MLNAETCRSEEKKIKKTKEKGDREREKDGNIDKERNEIK
jgi:hypothetical protein